MRLVNIVFISSVSAPWRADIRAPFLMMEDARPFGMEEFGLRGKPPLDVCLEKIAEADFFCGIIGPRYGKRPQAHPEYSYTEHEYRAAKAAGKTCIMAILPDLEPGQSPEDLASLARFKEEVRHDVVSPAHMVKQVAELPTLFSNAFHNWRLGLGRLGGHGDREDVAAAFLLYDLVEFGRDVLRPEALADIHARLLTGIDPSIRADVALRGKSCRIVVPTEQPRKDAVDLALRAKQAIDSFRSDICSVRFAVGNGPLNQLRFDEISTRTISIDYAGEELDSVSRRLAQLKGGQVALVGDVHPAFDRLDDSGFVRRTARSDSGAGGTAPAGEARLWEYRRPWSPGEADVLPVSEAAVSVLESPLLAAQKARELMFHKVPHGYGGIRRALLKPDRSLAILIGRPGIGKSLCALRLVAELVAHDGRQPFMPRAASGVWSVLTRRDEARRVVFLDDAFGKTFARRPDEIEAARVALRAFLGLPGNEEDEDQPGEGDEARLGQRPVAIVTVRPDVWDDVVSAWDDAELLAALQPHVFTIEGDGYGAPDYAAMFEALWNEILKGQPRDGLRPADFAPILRRFHHPMDVRDYFDEMNTRRFFLRPMQSVGQAAELARRYDGDPAGRYRSELEQSDGLDFLYLLFAYAFGKERFATNDLAILFDLLGGQSHAQRRNAWALACETKARWGRWLDGHFVASHPLREEAFHRYFGSAAAAGKLDAFFEALKRLCRATDAAPRLWQAAALAVPSLGEIASDAQIGLLEMIIGRDDGHAERVGLANAIGERLGNHYDEVCRRTEARARSTTDFPALLPGASEQLLTQALRRLLQTDAGGAAASAVCDSFRRQGDAYFGPDLVEPVAALATADPPPDPGALAALRDAKSEIAWAIAHNFAALPASLRDILDRCAADSDEWVRLRAGEAILDYYEPLVAADIDGSARRFEGYMMHIHQDPSVLVRRGLAASFDEIEELGTTVAPDTTIASVLLELGTSDSTDLDTLEWVIWTCGQRLPDLLRLDRAETLRLILEWTLHPNVRVRRWVADLLRESLSRLEPGEDMNQLSMLLARLADDPNERVSDLAARFDEPSWQGRAPAAT